MPATVQGGGTPASLAPVLVELNGVLQALEGALGQATVAGGPVSQVPLGVAAGNAKASAEAAATGAAGATNDRSCGCARAHEPASPAAAIAAPAATDASTAGASTAATAQTRSATPAAAAPAGDDVRSRIVAAAQGEVGVVESGGEDRGERIVEYRRAVTGDGEQAEAPEPWCADFVSWAYRQAGVPINDGRGEDYVPFLKEWAQRGSRYHSGGSYQPRPGDIAIFDWDGGRDDHVGIVEKVEGGMVHTIDGNFGDKVQRNSYPLGDARLTGYVSATAA